MNIKDFKWTEKRFGTRFANILKKLGGLSKDSTDGSIEYKDDQGNVTKLVTDSNFSSLIAKNGLIEVKWQELKDKRDNGQLIPGSLYRITDYNCTTTQENTRSAGHQFDIVLLALSENKLAEEGWAMMHNNIYDVVWAGTTAKKAYIEVLPNDIHYVEISDTTKGLQLQEVGSEYGLDLGEFVTIDESTKTVNISIQYEGLEAIDDIWVSDLTYNYFQNSNLSAWKVWYCLDNDTDRFAWADGGSVQPATITVNNVIYTDTGEDVRIPPIGTFRKWKSENNETVVTNVQDNVTVGTTVYSYSNPHNTVGTVEVYVASTLIINGRGVIYRLIDEFNNDVAYDFKNIQFYNESFGEYIYAITDNEALGEDPTLDGVRVKAIHLLSNWNNELRPICLGRLSIAPLENVIFINNSSVAAEMNNTIAKNGRDVV